MLARRAGSAILALTLGLGWLVEAPAGADDGPLAELNERWAGARCRLRLNVPIKKGRDGEGWSRSVWIVPRNEGMGLGGALLSVSDRDRTTTRIPDSRTPEGFRLKGGPGVARGTSFIAEGWQYQDAAKQAGLVLNLRFTGGSERARMVFRGKRGGKLDRQALGNAERWARIELFELQAADEALVEIAASNDRRPATPARSAAGTGAPTPAAASLAGGVEVRVLGVAVEPLRVVSGGEIALVVTYSVTGGQSGRTVELLERRTILGSAGPLTTLEARVSRLAGTHESRQALRVPAELAAGVYELRASVEGPVGASEGTAIFQVVVAGG